MKSDQFIYWCFSTLLISYTVFATEFTFELPDGSIQCFHEVIKANVECTFEFQVQVVKKSEETSQFRSSYFGQHYHFDQVGIKKNTKTDTRTTKKTQKPK